MVGVPLYSVTVSQIVGRYVALIVSLRGLGHPEKRAPKKSKLPVNYPVVYWVDYSVSL